MKHIQEKYGVPSNSVFFEKAYYSHLMGLRKPEKEIFEHLVADTDILPTETLFIDDSPQHLEAAEKLGFRTTLCSKEEPLEEIVKRLAL